MMCAIHQPNFFPWLGYFDKIVRSDIFVFMDTVQYPQTSRNTWSNRVAILINNQQHWISCPIIKPKEKTSICNIIINNEIMWREKLIKTLEINYKKSKYFVEVFDFLYSLINYSEWNLANYNCNIIMKLCYKLDIGSVFIRQSDLNTTLSSTELLIEIANKIGCNTYMCGGGAIGYQNDNLFSEYGIQLIYQNYISPVYDQHNVEFVKGLSIIDALFHCGFEGTRELLYNPRS